MAWFALDNWRHTVGALGRRGPGTVAAMTDAHLSGTVRLAGSADGR